MSNYHRSLESRGQNCLRRTVHANWTILNMNFSILAIWNYPIHIAGVNVGDILWHVLRSWPAICEREQILSSSFPAGFIFDAWRSAPDFYCRPECIGRRAELCFEGEGGREAPAALQLTLKIYEYMGNSKVFVNRIPRIRRILF